MNTALTPLNLGAPSWSRPRFRSILDGAVVRRAALVALVLGTVLAVINQWPALIGREPVRYLPLVLVYLTPFVVVTISQVLGIRRAITDGSKKFLHGAAGERFLETALGHGIPWKALALGLLAGSVNSAIVLAAVFLETGALGAVPLSLMAQAYSLPVVFGVLSQTIAYRRAGGRLAG